MTHRRRILKALIATAITLVTWPLARASSGGGGPEEGSDSTAADSTSVLEDSSSRDEQDSTKTEEPSGETVAIPLEKVKSLGEVGGSVILKIRDRKILLIRDSQDSVKAFASACTHRQVTLKYNHKKRRIDCPAHGSRFDLEGSVLRGPAKYPLRTYHTGLQENRIIITFEHEQ